VRFGDIPDFFDNDPLVLDLSPLQAQSEEPIDFPALLAMLRSYHVLPVAARGGTPGQMAAALRAGLAPAPEAAPARNERAWIPDQVRNDSPKAPAPAANETPLASALVIDRPLRSGQQVYARGRDL